MRKFILGLAVVALALQAYAASDSRRLTVLEQNSVPLRYTGTTNAVPSVYRPRAVGDTLVLTKAGQPFVYLAIGATTNDWIQIAPPAVYQRIATNVGAVVAVTTPHYAGETLMVSSNGSTWVYRSLGFSSNDWVQVTP